MGGSEAFKPSSIHRKARTMRAEGFRGMRLSLALQTGGPSFRCKAGPYDRPLNESRGEHQAAGAQGNSKAKRPINQGIHNHAPCKQCDCGEAVLTLRSCNIGGLVIFAHANVIKEHAKNASHAFALA